MVNTRKVAYGVIALLVTLGVLAVVLIASLTIKQPSILAQSTSTANASEQPANTPSATEEWALPVFTATSGQASGEPTGTLQHYPLVTPTNQPEDLTPTPVYQITPGGNPDNSATAFCDTQGVQTLIAFLLDDSQPDRTPTLVVIRYISIDYTNEKIYVLGIPPELIVSGRTMQRMHLDGQPLSLVFDYAVKNVMDTSQPPERIAANIIARVVYEQLGMIPQNIVILRASGFANLVDQIGKISNPHANSGTAALDGSAAWMMMRSDDAGFYDRMLAQDAIFLEIKDLLKDPAVLEKIPGLVADFEDLAETDLSNRSLLQIVCAIENVPAAETTFFQIDPHDLLQNENKITIADPQGVQAWLAEAFPGAP